MGLVEPHEESKWLRLVGGDGVEGADRGVCQPQVGAVLVRQVTARGVPAFALDPEGAVPNLGVGLEVGGVALVGVAVRDLGGRVADSGDVHRLGGYLKPQFQIRQNKTKTTVTTTVSPTSSLGVHLKICHRIRHGLRPPPKKDQQP